MIRGANVFGSTKPSFSWGTEEANEARVLTETASQDVRLPTGEVSTANAIEESRWGGLCFGWGLYLGFRKTDAIWLYIMIIYVYIYMLDFHGFSKSGSCEED